jgi:opacity protein-like surface antigen
MMATGSYLRFPLGDKSDDLRWYIGSRYTLTRNWTVRLEYNHRRYDNDILFSMQVFF